MGKQGVAVCRAGILIKKGAMALVKREGSREQGNGAGIDPAQKYFQMVNPQVPPEQEPVVQTCPQ